MFTNRLEAGLILALKLKKYQQDPGIVLAVPRGGVPVAYAVAKELGFPLELILTKKIGHPMNKEYAIGAASIDDYFVIPHNDVSEEYITREVEKIRFRLRDMNAAFMKGEKNSSLDGKTVIVIDDGIATGSTLLSTINLIKKGKPGKIVIGVPVASKTAVKILSKESDEVIAVKIPEVFHGVGAFYENFEQVSDEEVIKYLEKIKKLTNVH
jgi:putative phosphoribosyl transferase